jgi:small basic protein
MIAFLGIILAVYFNFSLPDIYSAYIPLLLICAPMTLGGLLFIEADWTSKKRD